MQIINVETRKYKQEAKRVEDQEDVHPAMLWLSGLWFAYRPARDFRHFVSCMEAAMKYF